MASSDLQKLATVSRENPLVLGLARRSVCEIRHSDDANAGVPVFGSAGVDRNPSVDN